MKRIGVQVTRTAKGCPHGMHLHRILYRHWKFRRQQNAPSDGNSKVEILESVL